MERCTDAARRIGSNDRSHSYCRSVQSGKSRLYEPQSIANLWELGGFEIFKELTPAADQMRTLEININTLKRQLKNAEEEFKSIKARYKDDASA